MTKLFLVVVTAVLLSSAAMAASPNPNHTPIPRMQVAVNGCPGDPCREWCKRYVAGTDLELGCMRKCNIAPPYGTPPCVCPGRTCK